MLQTRIIPTLLLKDGALVKTVKFGRYSYIGDPINTVRIFNELEVDELIFLDITASKLDCPPDFKLLAELSNECFMPLAYGGGIKKLDDIKRILNIGLEKVAINSYAFEDPDFITKAAELFGSQAIIGSIDIKRNLFGKYEVFTLGGGKNTKRNPIEWAKELEKCGAGELLVTAIDREGTWDGFDLELVKSVADAVSIPVIAHGGAGAVDDIAAVVKRAGASAVGLGSMVVFQKKDMGVLVNFPDQQTLRDVLR